MRHDRQLVRDIEVIQSAIEWVDDVRSALHHPKRKMNLLSWIQRLPVGQRERYEKLVTALRRGKVSTAEGVAILVPEAIGVFPGVGYGFS